MRILQNLILKLLGLLTLVGGVGLAAMWWNEGIYALAIQHGKELFQTPYYAPAAAAALIVLAFVGIMPLKKKKRPRNTISFPGIRGDVSIELDSVEANLGRVIGKMPEVKKIKVKVAPSEDNRRAVVSADVLMYKGASGVSAHEIANRIAEFLNDAAVNILGVDEVTKVNLNVRDIIVNAKQLAAVKQREAQPKLEETTPAPAEEGEPVAVAIGEAPEAASSESGLGACGSCAEEESACEAAHESEAVAAPESAVDVSAADVQSPSVEDFGFAPLTEAQEEEARKKTDDSEAKPWSENA
mgnify:CR=1 FL=1